MYVCLCMYVWLPTDHVKFWQGKQFEYKTEQMLTDRNNSDPLVKVQTASAILP